MLLGHDVLCLAGCRRSAAQLAFFRSSFLTHCSALPCIAPVLLFLAQPPAVENVAAVCRPVSDVCELQGRIYTRCVKKGVSPYPHTWLIRLLLRGPNADGPLLHGLRGALQGCTGACGIRRDEATISGSDNCRG